MRPLKGDQGGGADGGMSGKRQFDGGRKNAQARGVDGVARLKDEDAFGQVEFARDRLHARGVESVGAEHDRQRIARQRPL